MAVYCIVSGDRALMHFVKSGKGIANLYCAQTVFTDACGKGSIIEMVDDAGHSVRVVPTDYCDYGNLFFADDLLRAGICAEEIERMRQGAKL